MLNLFNGLYIKHTYESQQFDWLKFKNETSQSCYFSDVSEAYKF